MNKIRVFTPLIVSLTLMACANISILKENTITDKSAISKIKKKCAPINTQIFVESKFISTFGGTLILESTDIKSRYSRNTAGEDAIIETLENSGLFQIDFGAGFSQKENTKYRIEIKQTLKKFDTDFQKYLISLSHISLGLIPGWGDGLLVIEIDFYKIGSQEKSHFVYEYKYSNYQHLFLLPFSFFYGPGSLRSKCVADALTNVMNSLVSNGKLCEM